MSTQPTMGKWARTAADRINMSCSERAALEGREW